MQQLRHSSFRLPRSFCIVHCALCIAIALCATSARAGWAWLNETAGTITNNGWRLVLSAVEIDGTAGYAVTAWQASSTARDGDGDIVLDLRGMPVPLIAIDTADLRNRMNKLYLPDTLMRIGKEAFGYGGYDLTSLKVVEPFLPASLRYLGASAFQRCTNLKSPLRIEGPVTFDGGYHFRRCYALPEAILGKKVTRVPDYFLYENSAPTNIVFEGPIDYVGIDALYFGNNASGYRKLTLSSKPSTWGDKVFWGGWGSLHSHVRLPADLWETAFPAGSLLYWNTLEDDKSYTVNGAKYTGAALKTAFHTGYPNDPDPSAVLLSQVTLGSNTFFPKGSFITFYERDLTGVKELTVRSDVAGVGTPTPPYGGHGDVADDMPLSCSVNQYAVSSDNVLYESYSSILEKSDNGVWRGIATNDGRQMTFNPSEDGVYRLTWRWRPVGYRPTIKTPTLAIGTVTELSTPFFDGAYLTGTTARFVAAETGEGIWRRWYGNVPETIAENREISVDITGPTALKPDFHIDEWIFDSSTSTATLTDGDWKLYTVAKDVNDLTVGHPNNGSSAVSVAIVGANPLCDLSKRIRGGGKITGLARAAFRYQNCPKEIRFPKTLVSIGDIAFQGTTAIKTVVFKSYPTISSGAFSNTGERQMVWHAPAGNDSWQAFAADAAKLKPWASLTAAQRNSWTAPGRKPVGLTVGFQKQWLVLDPEAETIIMLR